VFHGSGVEFAETLIRTNPLYTVDNTKVVHKASFEGLRCMWQRVPARQDEIVSLLIKPDKDANHFAKVYREVLSVIEDIYGDKSERFPIKQREFKVMPDLIRARLEAKVSSYGKGVHESLASTKIFCRDSIDYVRSYFKKSKSNSVFNEVVMGAFDSEKIDDMLKMVITGTERQRKKLKYALNKMYKDKKLVYGMHVADSVYITCFIHEKGGKNIQFIDGSNGGYTVASKELKNKIKWKKLDVLM
jgi:hypothetical protein